MITLTLLTIIVVSSAYLGHLLTRQQPLISYRRENGARAVAVQCFGHGFMIVIK